MMNVEEEHVDILQNIEFAIVSAHRQEPQLVDFDVENAVGALISHYQAQAQNRQARPVNLNVRAKRVYDRVEAMCDWRLGIDESLSADMKAQGPRPEPVTSDVIVACLKRIRKSIQRWNREGGRQGYLTFIERFIA